MSETTAACDLHEFAAAVAHELRTPLTAVAGELEVALRRERSVQEYRDILRRIAVGVSEMVAISGDLAVLSEPLPSGGRTSASAPFGEVFAAIRSRFTDNRDVQFLESGTLSRRVAGEEHRLTRAVVLVIDHAVKYRRERARVLVHAMTTAADHVTIEVSAQPPGFWPHAWDALRPNQMDAAAPLRLRTAQRVLHESAAALRHTSVSGTDTVEIQLLPSD